MKVHRFVYQVMDGRITRLVVKLVDRLLHIFLLNITLVNLLVWQKTIPWSLSVWFNPDPIFVRLCQRLLEPHVLTSMMSVWCFKVVLEIPCLLNLAN